MYTNSLLITSKLDRSSAKQRNICQWLVIHRANLDFEMHSHVLVGYINACLADKDNKGMKWRELAKYSVVASCRKLMSRFRGKYWEIFELATGDVPHTFNNITSLPLPLPTATEAEKIHYRNSSKAMNPDTLPFSLS